MERSLLNDSGCHSLILSVGKANDDDNLSETAFTLCRALNPVRADLPICSSVGTVSNRKRKSDSYDIAPINAKRSAVASSLKEDQPHYSSPSYSNYEYMILYNKYDNNENNNNNNNTKESRTQESFFATASTSSDSDAQSPVLLSAGAGDEDKEEINEFSSSEYTRIIDEDGNYVFYKKGEYEHSCAWTKCEVSFPTAEGLYDHIIETHVDYLKTIEPVPDQVVCYFDECEMCIARGDRERKYMWLAKHIRDRHCTDARTYKCLMENCPERFSCPTKLEAHVRNEHILSSYSTKSSPNEKFEKKKDSAHEKKGSHKEGKSKKMEATGGKKKEEDVNEDDDFYNKDDPNSCFGLVPIHRPRYQTHANRFLWMPSHDQILLKMYENLLTMNNDYNVLRNQRRAVGAAHRKTVAIHRLCLHPNQSVPNNETLRDDYDNSFVSIKTDTDRKTVRLYESRKRPDRKRKRCMTIEQIEKFSDPFIRNSRKKCFELSVFRKQFERNQHLYPQDKTTLDDLFPGWNYEEKRESLWANHPNKAFLEKYDQRCGNGKNNSDAEDDVDEVLRSEGCSFGKQETREKNEYFCEEDDEDIETSSTENEDGEDESETESEIGTDYDNDKVCDEDKMENEDEDEDEGEDENENRNENENDDDNSENENEDEDEDDVEDSNEDGDDVEDGDEKDGACGTENEENEQDAIDMAMYVDCTNGIYHEHEFDDDEEEDDDDDDDEDYIGEDM